MIGRIRRLVSIHSHQESRAQEHGNHRRRPKCRRSELILASSRLLAHQSIYLLGSEYHREFSPAFRAAAFDALSRP